MPGDLRGGSTRNGDDDLTIPTRIRTLLILPCLVLTAASASAQRHLPDLQVFHSVAVMRLDGQMETPAIFNGLPVAPGSGSGPGVEFQVFVPQAASQSGFSIRVNVARTDGSPEGFQITGATDWAGRPIPSVGASGGLTRALVLTSFDRIPQNGHVATVVVNPLQSDAFQATMRVQAWVTFVSDPPRRVWELRCEQYLRWP